MASKMSSTLPAQANPLAIPRWLRSPSSVYHVESFLGQGVFGCMVKCTRMSDKKSVAIKMIKNQGSLVKPARAEVAALKKVKTLDPDKCNIVRWYQVFTSGEHICLEFEQLDKSLWDLMKERNYQPLLLKEIRPIVQQLATALHHLKSVGMFHADLKLENVVLVNHAQEPYRVKLIDFGLADEVSAARVGSYVQTRYYRSPEVILGLPFTEAIDMWSLGCVAAELYLGCILFPGNNEYDMMRYITQSLGTPPQHLLSLGTKTYQFFQRDETTGLWKLKTPEQFQAETGIQPLEKRVLTLNDLLNDLLNFIKSENPGGLAAESTDRLMFADMLCGMLRMDAARRVTPQQVLDHPFITMIHMSSMDPLDSHIRSCVQLMDVCRKESQTSDSGTAVGGSPKPSSSRITCTGTETVRSGVKRRADEDDERRNETSHLSKRSRTEWHSSSSSSRQDPPTFSRIERSDYDRKRFHKSSSSSSRSNNGGSSSLTAKKMARREDHERSDQERESTSSAGPSTCSSSSRSRNSLHDPAAGRSHRAKSSPSTQTESRAQSGLKRKAEDDEEDVLLGSSDLNRRSKMRRTDKDYAQL